MALVDPAGWPTLAIAAVFGGAAIAVWLAGTRLARSADILSRKTRLGGALIGLLLLAGITSLPEAAVATTAALQGTPALSISDVLGSAAINLLILAIADAVSGRRALTSQPASPRVLMQGVLGMGLFTLVAVAALIGDSPFLGIGRLSWLLLAAYLACAVLLSRSKSEEAWKPRGAEDGSEDGADDAGGGPSTALVAGIAAAAAVILVGGFLLARTASELAERSGLGESFFGAVVLGFCTSLPEVSTVTTAVRLKQYEMATSEIMGTNLFNLTIIVLVDAISPGDPVLPQAGDAAGFSALLAMSMTALYLVGMLERRDRTVLRMGWDSLLVICVYIGGIWMLHGITRA